jgi:CubicO group peptidase (beta-lactamase class C family)
VKNLSDELDLYTQLNGPGLIYTVLRDGLVEEMNSGGYADIQNQSLITPNSVFNIASNSKSFTAASILLLARNGTIRYDDLVTKFIPELPEYARKIQIKHLIFHASGLPHYTHLFNSPNPVTNKDVIQFLLSASKLEFPPGSSISYNNTGYVLLAEVVQRLSGEEFPKFIKKNIFDPLDMQSSWVQGLSISPQSNDRAIGYDPWPAFQRNDFNNADYVYGDGGFMINMTDFIKWLSALHKPGFFSLQEIEEMFSPGRDKNGHAWEYQAEPESFSFEILHYYLTDRFPDLPAHYGFGWILGTLNNQRLFCHGGAWCGYRSVVAFAPEQKLWIAMFSNYAGTSREKVLAQLLNQYLR